MNAIDTISEAYIRSAKNAQISRMLLDAKERNGGDIRAAFDEVFGEGSFTAMAGAVYDAIRARVGLTSN
jgi:hypothetical protein